MNTFYIIKESCLKLLHKAIKNGVFEVARAAPL